MLNKTKWVWDAARHAAVKREKGKAESEGLEGEGVTKRWAACCLQSFSNQVHGTKP